jgi:hypothetical protein
MSTATSKTARPRVNRTLRLLKISGRERLGLEIRDVRQRLIEACPQPISAVDEALCTRAALLTGHLAMLDKKALTGGGLAPSDARLYLSLVGAHARLMRQLGARQVERPSAPSLTELFAESDAA